MAFGSVALSPNVKLYCVNDSDELKSGMLANDFLLHGAVLNSSRYHSPNLFEILHTGFMSIH